MSFELNQDEKLRNSVLYFTHRWDDSGNFMFSVSHTDCQWLVDNNFVNPDEKIGDNAENDVPTIREILEFMFNNPTLNGPWMLYGCGTNHDALYYEPYKLYFTDIAGYSSKYSVIKNFRKTFEKNASKLVSYSGKQSAEWLFGNIFG